MSYFRTVKKYGSQLALFPFLIFTVTLLGKVATGQAHKQWVTDIFGTNPAAGTFGVAISAAVFTFLLFSLIFWAGEE